MVATDDCGAGGGVRLDSTIAAICKEFGEFDIFWVAPDGSVRSMYYAEWAWHRSYGRAISDPHDAAPGTSSLVSDLPK